MIYKKNYNSIKQYIKDRDKLKEILFKNGELFRFLPYYLRNDEELCIIACSSTNGHACKYASKELLNNKEFAKRTLGKYIPIYITYFSDEIKDDLEICKNELSQYPLFSERLRKNKELAIKAVEHSWDNVYSVDEELIKDEEIITKYWKGYKEDFINTWNAFGTTCSIIGIDDFGNNLINEFIELEKSKYKKLYYEERLDQIQFIKTINNKDELKLNKKIWDIEMKPLIVLIGKKENLISKQIKKEYEENEYIGIIEVYTQDIMTKNLKLITSDGNEIINLITVIIFQYCNIAYNWGYIMQEEKIVDKNIKIYKLQGNIQEIKQQIKLLPIKEGACINNIFCREAINDFTCKCINEIISKQIIPHKHNIYTINKCNIENIEVVIIKIE